MSPVVRPITPCLWFDDQAEQAAELYLSLFPDSRHLKTAHYSEDPAALGPKKDKAGQVILVRVELNGTPFTLLNGGPIFPQTEAVSFEIPCADQQEVDHYWNGLTAGGGQESRCGWCKDPFGVSWQVVPTRFYDLMEDDDLAVVTRVSQAMFTMTKFDIAALEAAARGEG